MIEIAQEVRKKKQHIKPKENGREIIAIRVDINEIEKEIYSRENYWYQSSKNVILYQITMWLSSLSIWLNTNHERYKEIVI